MVRLEAITEHHALPSDGGPHAATCSSTHASFSSPVCVCPHKPRQVTQIQAPLKPYHMSRTHNLLLLSASFESYQINQFSAGCAVLGFEGFLNLFGLSRVAVTTQQWRSALVIGGSPATVIQNILTLLPSTNPVSRVDPPTWL